MNWYRNNPISPRTYAPLDPYMTYWNEKQRQEKRRLDLRLTNAFRALSQDPWTWRVVLVIGFATLAAGSGLLYWMSRK